MTTQSQMMVFEASLKATLVRRDGSHVRLRTSGRSPIYVQSIEFFRKCWHRLRREGLIQMGFAAFLAWVFQHNYGTGPAAPMLALVTSAGIDYMIDDFAGVGGADVQNFNYHERGLDTTAADIAQTDLLSKIALARVIGTQSKPVAYQFRSVASVVYNATFSIGEWGLFSGAGAGLPPTGGSLWDRRVISPTAGVLSGETIIFEYNCTGTPGGS